MFGFGNSEVGHINIGAGRIVLQDLLKINNSIKSGEFSKKENFIDIINYIKKSKKNVHLIGLLSDGGVHSHISHLKEILYTLSPIKKNLFIHAFTDGRDVDPKSGINFINQIEEYTKKSGGSLASVIGRYYSMDRDHRWDRTKKAYDLLINNIGLKTQNIIETITDFYNNGITDEFIEPIVITDNKGIPIDLVRSLNLNIIESIEKEKDLKLTYDELKKVELEGGYDSIVRLIQNSKSYNTIYFPNNINFNWNNDNFGPIQIPKEGLSININLDNLPIYKKIIQEYENNNLEIINKKIYINHKESTSYTFKMDYYWMMGDNRYNSEDSRVWGFVPFDHVLGKPVFIWMSIDGLFEGIGNWKIRWDRVFTTVGLDGKPTSYFPHFIAFIVVWQLYLFIIRRGKNKSTSDPLT